MGNFIRILVLLFLTWSLVAHLYILAGLLALWYLLKFRGYELIAVAILVDGYYQAFYAIPYLSLGAILLVGLMNIIKPRLLMYTGENETIS